MMTTESMFMAMMEKLESLEREIRELKGEMPEYLTVTEFAKEVNMSVAWVRDQCNKHRINGTKAGEGKSKWVIHKSECYRIMQERQGGLQG